MHSMEYNGLYQQCLQGKGICVSKTMADLESSNFRSMFCVLSRLNENSFFTYPKCMCFFVVGILRIKFNQRMGMGNLFQLLHLLAFHSYFSVS